VRACLDAIADGRLDQTAVLRRAEALLVADCDHPDRVVTFREYCQRHVGWEQEWRETLPPEEVTAHVRASLIWLSVWHLLAAQVSVTRALEVWQVPPRQHHALAMADTTPDEPVRSTLADVVRTLRLMVVILASRAREQWEAFLDKRRAVEEQRKAAAVEAHAKAVAETAKRREAALSQQRTQNEVPTAAGSASRTQLNGRALRGSVFGTWLLLVVLSWFSLAWGAMISLPFGVGLGIVATFGAGIVAVPLWATLWGFIGMSRAHDRTLASMGFEPLDPNAPLAMTTARFAQALSLPPPRIGTVEAFNAFAVGVDQNYATVALGRPLLEKLTPAEVDAVIGHELGHIVSGDMRRMMLMRTFQNAMVWFGLTQGLKQFARWVLSWASELLILRFSRKREYWADAIGAALAGKEAMISALQKLDQGPPLTREENTHARFMIRGRAFSTHPSTQARIEALQRETYIERLPLQR
jgi:heat shock protein HtpX